MKKCFVGDIPVWLGAQLTPNLEKSSFGFEVGAHGLIRMSNNKIAARMVEAYSSDEYHFITSPPGASEWGNKLAQKSIDGLLRTYGNLHGKHILEIGAGTLFTAETLIDSYGAASVTIVDPALHDRPSSSRITVIRKYFNSNIKFDRSFDLIISFNTLEHVPDPICFLASIAEHMSDEMALYLKLPDCGESLHNGDLGLCVHEHLSYFTSTTLDACLKANGLERVANSNYQGALQVLAKKVSQSSSPACLLGETYLINFQLNYLRHISRLQRFFDSDVYDKIGFVGCSVGLCNILNLLDDPNVDKIKLFDNDNLKVGKYIPGINTPIQTPTQDALNECKAIFLTPMNFFEEIKAGLHASFDLGPEKLMPVFPKPN